MVCIIMKLIGKRTIRLFSYSIIRVLHREKMQRMASLLHSKIRQTIMIDQRVVVKSVVVKKKYVY